MNDYLSLKRYFTSPTAGPQYLPSTSINTLSITLKNAIPEKNCFSIQNLITFSKVFTRVESSSKLFSISFFISSIFQVFRDQISWVIDIFRKGWLILSGPSIFALFVICWFQKCQNDLLSLWPFKVLVHMWNIANEKI